MVARLRPAGVQLLGPDEFGPTNWSKLLTLPTRGGTMSQIRKLVVTENVSANGVIEFLDDWFDPTDEGQDQLEAVMAQSADQDAMLLGRQTFEDFRGYWPLHRPMTERASLRI